MNSNFESRLRNSSEMECALALPVGEHDVCDPLFQDNALVGVRALKLQAHAEAGVAVDDFCPGVEGALVADDLDDDSRADAERGEGVDVTTADAEFGSPSHQLGPSTDLEDLDRGHKWDTLYGAIFGEFLDAASAAWACFLARCWHSGSYRKPLVICQLAPLRSLRLV